VKIRPKEVISTPFLPKVKYENNENGDQLGAKIRLK